MVALGKLNTIETVRELSAETLDYLGSVMRDKRITSRQRIIASNIILRHHQWREEWESPKEPVKLFFALMGGPEQAVAWLRENRERLEAQAKQQTPPKLPEGT